MTAFEILRLALEVAALTISVGAVFYAHWRTRETARHAELVELRNRITRAEARLEETPTSKALHELALSIEHVGGDLKGMVARIDGLGAIVVRLERITERQEQHLLNTSQKS